MELLQAPFAAGSLTWVRYGPSHHAPRLYDQVKIAVLLGTTTARCRFSEQHPWRRLPARSAGFCLSGVGREAELAGEGQFFALFLDREYLGKRWAAAPPAERSRHDVCGVSDPYLFHLAAEAAARLRREQTLSPRYVESVALLASVHLREHYLQKRPVALDRPPAVLPPHAEARVLAHIRAHLGESLSLSNLAAVAGFSTSHFARAFRTSVGETPHRFIVRQRVERARELLRAGNGEVSLGEAAFQLGFSSQSHFTRCFRAMYGTTPGEFLHKERSGGART